MNKKKIAIIIDHPAREIDYLSILIVQLIQRGNFEIYLIEAYHKKLIYLIDPDIIISPHNRFNYFNIIKYAKEKSKMIYFLPTEGGILNKFNPYHTKGILKSLKFVNGYFCWGTKIYNFLKKNSVYRKKIYLTGTPKSDLLNSRLKKLYDNKKEYITFVTNFPNANPVYLNKQKKLDYKKQALFTNTNFSIRNKFLKIFIETVKKFKNKKFILKIHPFENSSYYKNRIKFKNVKIYHLEDIYEILSKSKKLIHYNCQSGFEYYISKSKPISYDFLLKKKEKLFYHPILKKISKKPKNYKEFFREISKKEIKYFSNSNTINKFFYFNDQLSSERIVSIILNDISKKIKIKNFSKLFFLKEWGIKKFIYFYSSNILKGRPKFLSRHPYEQAKIKNISIKGVNKKIQKIKKLLNYKKKITVSKFNYLGLLKIESVLKIE